MKIPEDMTIGSKHKVTDGVVTIVDYHSWDEVYVCFDGYEHAVIKTYSDKIRKGNVKNKMMPRLFGVGYLGVGEFTSTYPSKRMYGCWQDMMRRCYDKKSISFKSYGDKGVFVCDEWHNYQNFAKWSLLNYPKDGNKYQLDKDIKTNGNKVYSPDACVYVSGAENAEKASAKHYSMINPKGKKIEIYNMTKFCRENGLHPAHMVAVNNGKLKQHKGWAKAD
jgi:hypothetical protein